MYCKQRRMADVSPKSAITARLNRSTYRISMGLMVTRYAVRPSDKRSTRNGTGSLAYCNEYNKS